MTNKIDLVTKMLPLIDEVYKMEAKSSILEAPTELVRETQNAKTFEIAKMLMVGLGDYSKTTGFPEGDLTLEWESFTFANDRGRRFSIDRMDDLESFKLVSARMVAKFLREFVIPETDAYRFAKIASKAADKVQGTLDSTTAKKAIDTAITTLEEKEIDTSRLIIFTTPTMAQTISDNIERTTQNGENGINNIIDTYNDVRLIKVPQTRFYTGVTLDPGSDPTKGGYKKTPSTGSDINFIVMDREASVNITKSSITKLFTPDENQSKDAWQFDYRLYHDSFVFDNKAEGIYLHSKAAV